jgi:hypothetical protein
MRIALVGWGSLVWRPGELQIEGRWKEDGPYLPVEFARISGDGRLTLVICSGGENIQTLWASLTYDGVSQARDALKEREQTTLERIGFLSIPDNRSRCGVLPNMISNIRLWAKERAIEAVIWTDLPPNFEEETGTTLSGPNAVSYLKGLQGEKMRKAKEYVQKAPAQVDTEVRKHMRDELGWIDIRA